MCIFSSHRAWVSLLEKVISVGVARRAFFVTPSPLAVVRQVCARSHSGLGVTLRSRYSLADTAGGGGAL